MSINDEISGTQQGVQWYVFVRDSLHRGIIII